MFIGNSQSIFVWRVFCLRGRWQSVNNHLPPPLPLWWLPSGRDRPKTMCFLFLSFSSSFYGRLSKRGDGRMAWNLVAAEERGGTDDRFLWCCCQTEDVTGGMPPKPLPPPPPSPPPPPPPPLTWTCRRNAWWETTSAWTASSPRDFLSCTD